MTDTPLEAGITVAGEHLVLLPERAALWTAARTLLVADAHWGKAAAFRAGGLPVPEATTLDGLERLDRILARHEVRRILYLGDYLHARTGRSSATLGALREWVQRRPELEQVLVRGNHDRGAGDPPADLGVRCVDAPMREEPFSFRHFPAEDGEGYVMAGHVHPAVRLVGRGRQRARLPCFWVRPRCAVLPSFGDFTGAGEIEPRTGHRVFVVLDHGVLEVPETA